MFVYGALRAEKAESGAEIRIPVEQKWMDFCQANQYIGIQLVLFYLEPNAGYVPRLYSSIRRLHRPLGAGRKAAFLSATCRSFRVICVAYKMDSRGGS